ncbi:MAG: LamG-like jellyroll fold domain-containing protein [Planctomycetota bacterium]|jgi:hypothetical protein
MMWHIEGNSSSGDISVSREGGSTVAGYGVPVIGEWEHCAFTFDGTNVTLYRDGEEVGSGGFSFGSDPEAAMQFGSCEANGGNPWNGALDEVRLYNTALTNLEVRHLAGAGPLVIPEVPDEYVPPIYGPLALNMQFEGDYVSGPGREATPVGDISFEDDPLMGSVVSLPGGSNQYVDCGSVGISGNDPTTIACWAKADHTNIPDWTLIFGFTGTETGQGGSGSHFNIGSIGGPQGIGAHVWGWEETILSDAESLDWHHYAMTYDGSRIEYYADGVHKDTDGGKSNVRDLSIRADRVYVGSRRTQDSSFPGKVDDARIYNYALSVNEIMSLAGAEAVYTPPIYGPLIAAYDFDEGNANDSSGNGNHGTMLGDATIVDGVLKLDGNGDCIDIGNDPAFDFPGSVTISAWVNLRSWGGSWGNTIIGKRGEGGVGWQLRRFGGDPRFSWTTRGMGNDDYPRSSQSIAFGEWYHLAAVRDGTQKRLYINGALESTQGINSNPVNTSGHKVYIGARANGGNTGPEAFFDGDIDNLRVYSAVLSPAQIAGLANFVPENVITDTWSAWGFADIGGGGTGVMDVATAGVPGLPYYIGEVSREVEDLSIGGAAAASVWFRGDGANAAEHMYAALSDGDDSAIVLYDGDPDDLANDDWQEWNIDLSGVAATEIALGLAGLDGTGAGDLMTFDDLRTYPPRCLPDLRQPNADINNDCKVDMGDLQVLVDQWGAEAITQDWEHRVAYWDSRYRTNWADEATSVAVRDALVAVGYTVVDADELKTWMDARIADGALSVVVLCRDNAPDTVVESVDANCTLRKYLDAGGKLVFYADIPFWDIGHADGSWDNPAAAGQANILGIGNVDHWDTNHTVTITDVGAAWGLTQTWQSLRANDPTGLTVLATDDDGHATAYVKHYVPGDVARGFVRLYDRTTGGQNVPIDDIVRAAEHKGTLTADLYEDGKVDWNDVFVLLDDWMAEELWP